MRLHHLEVTAFGPFAATTEVDFDELSAAGVFLLTGATGAGKTSVLDAVCFALYGQVPGDRSGARHLRSDHAAPGVAPRVVLRASIGDRTFRFTRSPAWSRPKQRGSGETRVPAHAVVEERRGGAWVALTNRLDDAGLLVGDLLGMTATQFTQVAMLPQGRFQAFLRATSTERHAVLQRLFRTDRFEQVERWLVERRVAGGRAGDAAAGRVAEALHRLQEAAGVDQPTAWADDLAGAARRGEVSIWARDAAATAEAARVSTAASLEAAEGAVVRAEEDLAASRRLRELQVHAESAARDLVRLDGRAEELSGVRADLAAHRRAAPLAAVVARSAECEAGALARAARWQALREELTDLPEEPTRPVLAALHEEAVVARTVAEAFVPRAEELGRTRERAATAAMRITTLTEDLRLLEERLTAHPASAAAARAAVADAQVAAADLVGHRRTVADLEGLVDAGRRLAIVSDELAVARTELASARDAALATKEHYLSVREARINGMAAELAGALASGCACPVCGSASHPAPAAVTDRGVGRAEEDAARRAHEDAAFVQQNHEVRVATLATEVETLGARLCETDPTTLPQQLAQAQHALGSARATARGLDAAVEALERLEGDTEAARAARDRALVDLAAARQEQEALSATVAVLAAELEALLSGDATDLDALIEVRSARCELLERTLQAFIEHDEAARAAKEASDAAWSAAREAGFDDPASVAGALLDERRADELAAVLSEADATRLAAERVLAEPETRAAVAQPEPDLHVAVARHRLATDAVRASASALDAATGRAQRVGALVDLVQERLDAWAPLRDEHDLLSELSQLVEGKGPDNPLRIRLASYVLSERLRQVVEAANERLARMTDQRYTLEHTDDRGAGEQRGGLSLRVRDAWNGVPRDPATLSGGETFVVSLALALGLADTVAHEAGGTDIDTLFIDEGFGSLDPDTLEDVMDTLDTLRDGGRVVGLVSHVPELRSRITTQLEVVKGRNGSTLRPVLSGG